MVEDNNNDIRAGMKNTDIMRAGNTPNNASVEAHIDSGIAYPDTSNFVQDNSGQTQVPGSSFYESIDAHHNCEDLKVKKAENPKPKLDVYAPRHRDDVDLKSYSSTREKEIRKVREG